jgi:LysM repeat protein
MSKKSGFIFQIILMSLLISCRAYRTPVSSERPDGNAKSYIESYKNLAISEMKRTGIPASITLAQGMIESDCGRGRLATEANNHFGIKCHDDWRGPTIRHTDDRRKECFRKYSQAKDSFKDHSDFLSSESRYRSLFILKSTDYKGWARGLKRAGYATNPDYANMLIRKIDEYNLYNYDLGYASSVKPTLDKVKNNEKIKGTAKDSTEQAEVKKSDNFSVIALHPRIIERNRIQYIIVKEGDTRESLEKEYNLLRWQLPRYNELNPDFMPTYGQVLYLQPKREKAEPGKDFHTVAEGESMYQISQTYGIKLKSLYNMNRMTEGSEPAAGQKIWLRSVKPVH